MESNVWSSTTFSPDNQLQHLQQQQLTNHPQSTTTPLSDTHHLNSSNVTTPISTSNITDNDHNNNNNNNSNNNNPNNDNHHHQDHMNLPPSHSMAQPNFSDSEQMFLQQIEQNLYEHQQQQQQQTQNDNQHHQHQHQHHHHHHSTGNTPDLQFHSESNDHSHHQHHQSHPSLLHHINSNSAGHTPSSTLPPPPTSYEFGLENMNFIIPEDLNFDTDPNHVSSAFPPNLPSNHQTPSLLAVNKQPKQHLHHSEDHHHQQQQLNQLNEDFSSPILPGQNEKSFNNQHYFHRQNSAGKMYTTRDTQQQQHVRPDAVFTPLVSPAVTPLDKGMNSTSSASFQQPPAQVAFEPLTSPALTAQNSSNDRRRSASSAYAPHDSNQINTAKSYKRRTPHGTPILQANNQSNNNQNKNYKSPSIKPKNNGYTAFEKLPESSIDHDNNEINDKSTTSSNEMLPPSGKPLEINDPPLMGFTMGKLAEEEQSRKPNKKQSSRKSSYSKSRSASSSENSSPVLNKKPEKPATKKASHKLAEQGRRNRMNMAVHELGVLIPQNYHEEVSIPSKATTVELASKYIKALLEEINELKSK